ncbi:MAG TPA: hypothetical protein VNV17_14145 [Solirubrobacteraceae bacterium]|jgi:hypothetical protein|nr:hypothetical protein [Solirubrobacteraceae bacterium]
MHAYKVLKDGQSEFTGWRWPLPAADAPGDWVHAEGPIALCVNGIHASTSEQLPHWLGIELWEIELAGNILDDEAALVASQARLLRRVDAWDEPMRGRFAEMCLQRARELVDDFPAGTGLVTKVEHTLSWAGAAPAGYFTAMLAGERDSGARAGRDYDVAFLRERSRQARWLREQLKLTD